MKLTLICLTVMLMAVAGRWTLAEEPVGFESREYSGADGSSLLYQFLVPPDYKQGDAGQRHPLLIFLHGAGERGNDNKAQLVHGRQFMEALARDHGCFVIAPQCPSGKKWVEVNWSAPGHDLPDKPSEPMGALLQVLHLVQQQFRIDSDRLYVMGLSMGGYGTWGMIQRNPEMFAAAVPICGGADNDKADCIKDIPIWCFHGGKDGVVPTVRSREIIEAIRDAGGKPKYTEFPGVGHNSWSPAFAEPELPGWLMAQKRTRE
jgi:predicted peptidase